MKVATILLAAIIAATPAAVMADEPKQQAETNTDKDNQNRVICKRDKSTGSRLGSKRNCMTAAQWQQAARDQREIVERTQASRIKND